MRGGACFLSDRGARQHAGDFLDALLVVEGVQAGCVAGPSDAEMAIGASSHLRRMGDKQNLRRFRQALQSFADLIKFVVKEPIIPSGSNKGVFLLAPLVSCILALAAWAVIPRPEAIILWLRNNLPGSAERILDRARQYYQLAASA